MTCGPERGGSFLAKLWLRVAHRLSKRLFFFFFCRAASESKSVQNIPTHILSYKQFSIWQIAFLFLFAVQLLTQNLCKIFRTREDHRPTNYYFGFTFEDLTRLDNFLIPRPQHALVCEWSNPSQCKFRSKPPFFPNLLDEGKNSRSRGCWTGHVVVPKMAEQDTAFETDKNGMDPLISRGVLFVCSMVQCLVKKTSLYVHSRV